MVDIDKLAQNLKLFIKSAEDVFVKMTNKDENSNEKASTMNDNDRAKSSSSLKEFDVQAIVGFVQQMVDDYIKKQQDFSKAVEVKIKTWPHFKGDLPKYESSGASGLDVRAQLSEPLVIKPMQRVLVPTGLSMEVPVEYEIQARPRSGLAFKKGLSLPNTPGTIDADYRGEIKVIMINLGVEDVVIEDQERIAQLVICPVVKAKFIVEEDLSQTVRGEGGFGSTGSH